MIRTLPARWSHAILVCGKCSKRIGGGFGKKGRGSLAKAMCRAGLGGRGRKAESGVVETGCLKLCPRNAVVAVDTRRPDKWILVPAGTGGDELVRLFAATMPPAEKDAGMTHAPAA